jgi:2-polyprenyl-3-methyl-5-hydroxy-6-metoxy-1,4-benzoquinol methylase
VTPIEERWAEALAAWAIPQALIDAAPESPWGFPSELFRSRAASAPDRRETPTTRRAVEALPEDGTVLDVGAGGGAMSLPLALRASHLTAVDGQADMLEVFAEAATALGVDASTVLGTWPDVAEATPAADVVICGHVLYNVTELGPFVDALADHAARRVVVELTERHPLSWMNDLWTTFHGIARPEVPSDLDAAAVIRERGHGVVREVEVRTQESGGFARREDCGAMVRRRLCLRPDQDEALIAALGDRLHEQGGLWSAGPTERTVVTLWWDARR